MTHRTSLFGACLALLAMTSGCASLAPARCADGEQAMVEDRLYFGTLRPGGVVSDADWAAFLETSVTPAFPDGFTTWPAQGAWRGGDGQVVREASHVLDIVHPGDAASAARIAAIAAAYQARFEQEAVMRVRTPACVAL